MSVVRIEVPDFASPNAVRELVRSLLHTRALTNRVASLLQDASAVPAPATLHGLARVEQRWRDIELRYGLRSAAEVAQAVGSTAANRRAYAAGLRRQRRLLGVERAGRTLHPGFQFGADGRPLPVIGELAAVFGAAGWSDEDALLWLAAPSGWLNDDVPAELLAAEPERVVEAARAAVDSAAA